MAEQKQIEEMANLLYKILYVQGYSIEADNIPRKKVAEELLKHYQPKIQENALVPTMEE